MTEADKLFLALTLELAERGRFTCAPNPPVGCVIVRHGRVLGRGWHQRTGGAHAEVNALDDAGGPASVRGATVYVSLEPCAFEGRTPACAQTLVEAGVARVVMAAEDPHPQVAGEGRRMLERAGIEVEDADLPAAHDAIAGYVKRTLDGTPFVRIKTASSLDGATALASGESQWITGPAARADVQYLRARSDAIVTGAGTVLADNPALTVRDTKYAEATQPLRVVLDGTTSLAERAPAAQVFTDGGPTLLVHRGDRPAALPEHVESVSLDPHAPQAVLAHLAERGCNEVLVEAGAGVVGSFVSAGAWDEWICYVAPMMLGSDIQPLARFTIPALADAVRGELAGSQRCGDDLRLTLRRAPASPRAAANP